MSRPRLNFRGRNPAQDVLPVGRKGVKKLTCKEVKPLNSTGSPPPAHGGSHPAKKVRYAAEAVARDGEEVKSSPRRCRGSPEVLGEHHACRATDAEGTCLRPEIDGMSGFSLGPLHEFEFEQELFARNEFVELWPSVKRAHNQVGLMGCRRRPSVRPVKGSAGECD